MGRAYRLHTNGRHHRCCVCFRNPNSRVVTATSLPWLRRTSVLAQKLHDLLGRVTSPFREQSRSRNRGGSPPLTPSRFYGDQVTHTTRGENGTRASGSSPNSSAAIPAWFRTFGIIVTESDSASESRRSLLLTASDAQWGRHSANGRGRMSGIESRRALGRVHSDVP